MKDRRGPATVMGSNAKRYHWDISPGKVWLRHDPEPGELPVQQSP
ncbi:hypothetical protein SpAn4DRAFT_0954 [Sporomusa ovata]|uniref:Uncharacterized protein n=1 Tax=Sporomusa ovata TaxID=2378 RepID=A0A0U1L458_9FIRM|nr:hypothetical protein SpAn4DRAFT_0954 [Sporomusa ovata]